MEQILRIVYEDRQILVCRKPQGIAVQSAGVGTMDLEHAVKNYLAEKDPGKIPYLAVVHRLDQPVEGLVVFARTRKAAGILSRQIQDGTMEKQYLAVTAAVPEQPEGILEDYLTRDRSRKGSPAVIVPPGQKDAKKARLAYRVLEKSDGRTLLEIRLYTGRYHQIRVQMAGHGMPLTGDRKYNPQDHGSDRLALCAYRLSFCHPETGKPAAFRIWPENPVFAPFHESIKE